jgi:two-component system phosphate regulon sensor histidine kinase PhoR
VPLRSWKLHGSRLAIGALLVLLAGFLSGHGLLVLLAAVSVYLGWFLFNTFSLYRWLGSGLDEPPQSVGIWSEIFDQISRLQRQNREQIEQNQSIIGEFQSMTNAFPDCTLVLDDQDCITWFNESASVMLGLRNPGDIGQPVTNLLRDPDFADWIAVEEQVESRFDMDNPLDSNIRLSVSAVRHREDQRLLILRDVTDIYNLEQIRRDFVANVSHELRTPLTVLVGYLEAIHDQCPDDMSNAIERMQDQARQMQALLSDLLELSRLQSESRVAEDKAVDICGILMQLKEQAAEISQGRHTISVECQSGLRLQGKAKDLASAFRNLIANAIHYTPAGGEIRVQWAETEQGLCFSVADSGIGIPRRDIPRLTERFYRVGSDRSRHTGGTGLGLSIVKHVLNAHGARLVVESELGEGSTFSCLFPDERMVNEAAGADSNTPASPDLTVT